jgi:crossover junction endodeoxyribonuclease RusA
MTRRTYRLTLPWNRPPAALTGNARIGHWGGRSAASQEVRGAVAWLARKARIPRSRHLTVELVWAPGDQRKRDADNLWPTLKACCDGLARGPRKPSLRAAAWVGLDLVPDDTPRWMTKRAPRIVGPDETHEIGMWLIVTAEFETDPENPSERRARSVVRSGSGRLIRLSDSQGAGKGTPESPDQPPAERGHK